MPFTPVSRTGRCPCYNLYRCSIARNTPQGRETCCWLYAFCTTYSPQEESWQCPDSVQMSLSPPTGDPCERPGSTRDIWLGNGRVEDAQNPTGGTSQVFRWLRIHQPMQETQVRSLVREDSTCCGATKPMRLNYRGRTPQLQKPTYPSVLPKEKALQREACTPQLRRRLHSLQLQTNPRKATKTKRNQK